MTELFAEFVEDRIAWTDAVGLSDAIGPELARRQLPSLDESIVLPGAQVALDYIQGPGTGFSFVRLGNAFQTAQFPIPQQTYIPGAALQISRIFEVGIVRGFELNDDASPLTTEQWFEVSRLSFADMQAALAVICAYFRSREIPYVIGSWVPVGPDGGAVGGSWTVTAGSAL